MIGRVVHEASCSTSLQVSVVSMVHDSAPPMPTPVWPVGPPGRSRFTMRSPSGTRNPLRMSRSRMPQTGVSAVTAKASMPAASARSTSDRVKPRSCEM